MAPVQTWNMFFFLIKLGGVGDGRGGGVGGGANGLFGALGSNC